MEDKQATIERLRDEVEYWKRQLELVSADRDKWRRLAGLCEEQLKDPDRRELMGLVVGLPKEA